MKKLILVASALLMGVSIWPLRVPELVSSYVQEPVKTKLSADIIVNPTGWTSSDKLLESEKITQEQYRDYLGYDDVLVRTYSRNEGREQFTIYLGYWSAGKATINGVGGHTPTACLGGLEGRALFLHPSVSFSDTDKKFQELEHSYFKFKDSEKYPPMEVLFEHYVDGLPYAIGVPQLFRGQRRLENAFRFGLNQNRHEQYALRIMTFEEFKNYRNDPGFQQVLDSISKRIDK